MLLKVYFMVGRVMSMEAFEANTFLGIGIITVFRSASKVSEAHLCELRFEAESCYNKSWNWKFEIPLVGNIISLRC